MIESEHELDGILSIASTLSLRIGKIYAADVENEIYWTLEWPTRIDERRGYGEQQCNRES